MASIGNAMKMAQISNAVKSVVPKSDPEDPQTEEDSEPLITWNDYIENPGLFAPILIFTAAGFFGIILAFWAFIVDSSSVIMVIGGIILFIVGLWAAWEVRAIGSLADQISRLKGLREKLQAQTMKLQGEVGGMAQENKELEESVEAFRNQNNQLGTNVNAFDSANDNLRGTVTDLEGANSRLETDVQDLNEKNQQLEEILVKMSVQKDKMQSDLKDFDELRHHMESMAEESGEQIDEMISKTMGKFSNMDKLVRENEQVLLRQIAADVELIDEQEGLSRSEFKRFLARLPKRYRAIVEENNISFETIDHDNDESICPEEVTVLIDKLIEAHEAKKEGRKKKVSVKREESGI